MIRPAPTSKDRLLEDEKFLLEVSSSAVNLNATGERLFNVAWSLLAALKHEQGHRMTPVLDPPGQEKTSAQEQISDLEAKRRELEAKLGAKISWMEILSDSVPIGWGECVGMLWEEDECLRHDDTAPHLSWALRKFIGFHSLQELGPKLDRIDNEDSGLDLYAGGWVRLWSYQGDGLGRVYQVIQPPPDDGDEVSLEGMSSVEEWGFGQTKRSRGGL